jgi:hypothetical protein
MTIKCGHCRTRPIETFNVEDCCDVSYIQQQQQRDTSFDVEQVVLVSLGSSELFTPVRSACHSLDILCRKVLISLLVLQ